jgi:hypothetical protein
MHTLCAPTHRNSVSKCMCVDAHITNTHTRMHTYSINVGKKFDVSKLLPSSVYTDLLNTYIYTYMHVYSTKAEKNSIVSKLWRLSMPERRTCTTCWRTQSELYIHVPYQSESCIHVPYICICVIHTKIHTYIYIYICTHIYLHTHTYTHANIYTRYHIVAHAHTSLDHLLTHRLCSRSGGNEHVRYALRVAFSELLYVCLYTSLCLAYTCLCLAYTNLRISLFTDIHHRVMCGDDCVERIACTLCWRRKRVHACMPYMRVVQVPAYINTQQHLWSCIMYVCVLVCIHTYTHGMRIYIYIHIYIYTYIQA